MLEEYLSFFKKDATGELIQKYNIQMMLVRSKDKESSGESVLKKFLVDHKEWERVYEDEVADIYIKKT